MKKIILMFCGLMVCLSMASCHVMKSKHFPGKMVMVKDKDIGKEMSLHFEKKTFSVKFVDKDSAVIAYLQWNKEKKNYDVISRNMVISEIGETHFLNVKVDKDNYAILRYAASDNKEKFVLYTIDKDKVEKDIAAGLIEAKIVGHDVIFDMTKDKFDRYITENLNTLFDFEHPGILTVIQDK